jgi:peptidyl-dipeptidase A
VDQSEPSSQTSVSGGTLDRSAAEAFLERANGELLDLSVVAERAIWVQQTYITEDTELIAAEAEHDLQAGTARLAAEAVPFDGLALSADAARQLDFIKRAVDVPAPPDPDRQLELSRIQAALRSTYGRGRHAGKDLETLSEIMAEHRDAAECLDAWVGWRTVAPPMRQPYERFVALANEGARAIGFADLGVLWRSGYDMPPDRFAAEVERLWRQVRPLYEALHAHVRASLATTYGKRIVDPGGMIPAHLLGNMWSHSWDPIYPLVAPAGEDPSVDLTALLRRRGVDEHEIVRYAERFFTSLGFEPLPATFWARSLFVRPKDRDVECHPSAFDVDEDQDVRLKMCIRITGDDFAAVHHELGHLYYSLAYRGQPFLYRESANDGFHEAIGDVMALSVTPAYLASVGLLDQEPQEAGDVQQLLRQALAKVAFLPFSLLVDRWRWGVFSGEIGPDRYNAAWWDLVERYQGVGAPVARTEADFDPGSKYHVPANMPYARYFLATILQFQIHRAFARQAGHVGPLHRFSVYGDTVAGRRLAGMMAMGRSRPWPDALEALTGERGLDATALLDYFAPLGAWLDEQNRDRPVGWEV